MSHIGYDKYEEGNALLAKNIGKSGPYRLPISKERRLSDTQDLDWENKDR